MQEVIPYKKPAIKRKDLENVLQTIVKDNIQYGPVAKRFEKKLAKVFNCYQTIVLSNIYTCIHVLTNFLGLKPQDKIIIPSYYNESVFIALRSKNIIPLLIDLNKDSFQPSLDNAKKKFTNNIKAIIIPYTFGYPFDPEPYRQLGIKIIEDLSHYPGGLINQTYAGSFGDLAFTSLNPEDIITTGYGAAILCKDKKLYHDFTAFIQNTTFGRQSNCGYMLSDVNAAMGLAQIDNLQKNLNIRMKIAEVFTTSVSRTNNTIIQNPEIGTRHYYNFPILLKQSVKEALEYLKRHKIEAKRPIEQPLHHILDIEKNDFPQSEYLYLKTISIPIFPSLSNKQVEHIGKVISTLI